jgi:DNA-binding PadR family transcriptional regulator
MSDNGIDPLIHVPARLRIVVLQDLIELTPGNLITHLRKLEDAGYVTTRKTGNGPAAQTSVALTHLGRAALDRYTVALRELLDTAQASGSIT